MITIEVSEELSDQLAQVGDQLQALLARSLQQSPLTTEVYQYVLRFVASGPTPEQIAAFKLTPEMGIHLSDLLTRSKAGTLTDLETAELDAHEHIEHAVIMLKAGNLHVYR